MSIAEILELARGNSMLAGPLAFVVCFCGGLLGANLIVPAGAILTALGVLVGAGLISIAFVPWAVCGAALGMSVSFTLGRRLGRRVTIIPLLRSRLWLVHRASALFKRYGFVAILIAYYSGPLRAPVASIAAIAGMRRTAFEFANISSASVWVVSAMAIGAVPGMLVGPESNWVLALVFLVPAITVGISMVVLLLRRKARASHSD